MDKKRLTLLHVYALWGFISAVICYNILDEKLFWTGLAVGFFSEFIKFARRETTKLNFYEKIEVIFNMIAWTAGGILILAT